MTPTTRKSIAAADLATSEYALGNEMAARTAAYRSGELARKAGHSVDDLALACPAMVSNAFTWSYAVDGWYDAQEAA